MTRNTKIALGCGGAGCLGLIVVGVVCVVLFVMWKPSSSTSNYNFNISTNRNSNSGSNASSKSSSTSDSNSGTSNKNSSSSSSALSDDDKHKLYQAANMTGDTELIRRVSVKIGLMNEDFTPGDEYVSFVRDHITWAYRNADFIASLNSKEKAVAYVNEHFPE